MDMDYLSKNCIPDLCSCFLLAYAKHLRKAEKVLGHMINFGCPNASKLSVLIFTSRLTYERICLK